MSARRFFSFLSELDPITIAWFAGMSNPVPYDVKKIINDNLIKPCKPIIAKSNIFYFPVINNTNDSFRNIAKNDHHGTIEGTGLTFDSYWGWNNPSGTGWVDTHFNPSTQGDGKYTKDNAGIVCYPSGSTPTSLKLLMGLCDPSSYLTYIALSSSSNLFNNNCALNSIYGGSTIGNIPFSSGMRGVFRNSPTSILYRNQNIANSTASVNSSNIISNNIHLFKVNGLAEIYAYRGNISFASAGSYLTDNESSVLTNAVNDTLIKLLFYKYGANNWSVQMAKSYFLDYHNFEKYEAWEVYEFIKRHQPDYVDSSGVGYLWNTFGPNGQNKTVADFIMLFKAGGSPSANPWIKTGVTLRWNQDGVITSNNTMPAYTRGSNLGIITGTSTDGWNGLSVIYQVQSLQSVNSFYGNCPMFFKLKTTGKVYLVNYRNRYKQDYRGIQLSDRLTGFDGENIDYPGYIKVNTDSLIGGNYTGYTYLNKLVSSHNTELSGNLSLLTNEINCNTFRLASSLDLVGGLTNLVTSNSVFYLDFSNTGITAGLDHWNKYLGTVNLYNCNLNTAALNKQLADTDNYYVGPVVPIKSLAMNLAGSGNGVPTGDQNNVNRLSIIAKHVAAGWVATINVNS